MTTEENNANDAQPETPEALNEDSPTTADESAPAEVKSASQSTQAEEYLAGWQRTRAEFANYKKRVEREMRESYQNGALSAMAHILPIMDDFERAVQNIPADLQGNAWVNGTELLLPKLHKLLVEFNIELLDPAGEAFDPNKHQAIGIDNDDTDLPSGHVTQTLQKGYISGERVLRPALVKVKS